MSFAAVNSHLVEHGVFPTHTSPVCMNDDLSFGSCGRTAYCVCIEERFIIIGYQELTTDHSECEAVGVGDVDNIGGTLGQCCCETECS